MRFFLIIGKNNLFVYERKNNRFEKQFIEGNPFYPYDLSNSEENVISFLDALANEKNLGTKTKLQFDVLENQDFVRTKSIMKTMSDYVVNVYKIENVIVTAIKKLSKDKTLQIDNYGINYDGVSYKMENGGLLNSYFDLLAYAINDEDLVNLME